MMIDAKKAHLNPRCKEDVYIELPPESQGKAGSVWQTQFLAVWIPQGGVGVGRLLADVMEQAGFRKKRKVQCSVIFRHEEKDLLGVVHGEHFVFGGSDEDLNCVAKVLAAKFVINMKAILGPEDEDQKDELLLGRSVR